MWSLLEILASSPSGPPPLPCSCSLFKKMERKEKKIVYPVPLVGKFIIHLPKVEGRYLALSNLSHFSVSLPYSVLVGFFSLLYREPRRPLSNLLMLEY